MKAQGRDITIQVAGQDAQFQVAEEPITPDFTNEDVPNVFTGFEATMHAEFTPEIRAQSRYLRNMHKHHIDVLRLERLCAGGRR